MELLACRQCLLNGGAVVRSMQVEDVHTGGLEAAEREVHLFKNTLTLQTCQRK